MNSFRTHRKVEFADTDISGLVHFARLFVFMETAEHEFLRSLGTEVHTQHEGQLIGWPRVRAECEYLSPIRLGDDLEITVEVKRKGGRSLTYGFTFRNGEREAARGTITAVCCVLDDPKGLRSIPVPKIIADQI